MIEIICKPVLHFTILPPVFLFGRAYGQMSQSCYEQMLNLDEAHSRIIFQTVYQTSVQHSSLFPVFRLSISQVFNIHLCFQILYCLFHTCSIFIFVSSFQTVHWLYHKFIHVHMYNVHIYFILYSIVNTYLCFSPLVLTQVQRQLFVILWFRSISTIQTVYSQYSEYIDCIFVSVF